MSKLHILDVSQAEGGERPLSGTALDTTRSRSVPIVDGHRLSCGWLAAAVNFGRRKSE